MLPRMIITKKYFLSVWNCKSLKISFIVLSQLCLLSFLCLSGRLVRLLEQMEKKCCHEANSCHFCIEVHFRRTWLASHCCNSRLTHFLSVGSLFLEFSFNDTEWQTRQIYHSHRMIGLMNFRLLKNGICMITVESCTVYRIIDCVLPSSHPLEPTGIDTLILVERALPKSLFGQDRFFISTLHWISSRSTLHGFQIPHWSKTHETTISYSKYTIVSQWPLMGRDPKQLPRSPGPNLPPCAAAVAQ